MDKKSLSTPLSPGNIEISGNHPISCCRISPEKITLAVIGFILLLPNCALARRARDIDELMGRQFIRTTKDKRDYVLLNMNKTQKAAENYAAHNEGVYPLKMNDAFKSYFPLGNCDGKNYTTYTILHNPYTEKPGWPKVCLIPDVAGKGEPGEIEYYVDRKKNSYKICGRLEDGGLLKERKSSAPLFLRSSRRQASLANARLVQWAAERYNEIVRVYPIGMTRTFKCYFPGGDPKKAKPGRQICNPYTGRKEWPVTGKIKNLRNARLASPSVLKRGTIEYSRLERGSDYAIRVGGKNDRALSGYGGRPTTLVIARDGDGSGHERQF